MSEGGIQILHTPAEQVLMGTHAGVEIIVLGLRKDADVPESWTAACGLVDTFREAGSEARALVVDVANAQVRHAFVTRMEEGGTA